MSASNDVALPETASPFEDKMATRVFTDSSILDNAGTSPFLHTEPRHSAPPVLQQPGTETREDEIVWDESFMDVDDYEQFEPEAAPVPSSTSAPQKVTPQTSSGRSICF
jgi:hypothetical protein